MPYESFFFLLKNANRCTHKKKTNKTSDNKGVYTAIKVFKCRLNVIGKNLSAEYVSLQEFSILHQFH